MLSKWNASQQEVEEIWLRYLSCQKVRQGNIVDRLFWSLVSFASMTPSRYHVVRTLSVISPRTFFLLVIRFYRAKWHSTPRFSQDKSYCVPQKLALASYHLSKNDHSAQCPCAIFARTHLSFHFHFPFLGLCSYICSSSSFLLLICYHCYTNICTLKHFVLSLQ